MEWISIKEKEPDFNVPVFVCGEGVEYSLEICRLASSVITKDENGERVSHEFYQGRTGMDSWYYDVTYWMPLPEIKKQ